MACFLVPAAEAVVTTIVGKAVKSKEKENETMAETSVIEGAHTETEAETMEKVPFSRKIKWLSNLLWGGSGLLAFEHVWHGELTAWFPFLTAAESSTQAAEMIREMSTVGTGMAALVTVVWLGVLAVTSSMEKKTFKPHAMEKQGAEK